LIRTRAVHDAEDFPVTVACTVTRLRFTDFWTWGTLGLGRNRCGLLGWLDPELNPAKTNPNSARRISTSAMRLMVRLAEPRFQRRAHVTESIRSSTVSAPALSSGSFRFPHFGLCTHEGQP
jgi:hypothetical protein